MKDGYHCAQCHAYIQFSSYLKSRWHEPTNDRCPECGHSHAVLRGDVDPINPLTFPTNVPGKLSPWRIHYTRPFLSGPYHCRFMGLDGFIELHWNGYLFMSGNARVDMTTFQGWRGIWKSTP